MNQIYNCNSHEFDTDENYGNYATFNRHQQVNIDQDDSQKKTYDNQSKYNTPCLARKSKDDNADDNQQYSLQRSLQRNHPSDVHRISNQSPLAKISENNKKIKHETRIVNYYHSKCLFYYFF